MAIDLSSTRKRSLTAHWTLTGDVTLQSPAHFGGGEEGVTDMTLLRDKTDRRPLLTGASLAGALRGYLSDRLSAYRAKEPAGVADLFGGGRADDNGSQSPLIVFDSLGGPVQSEIRDGVAIEGSTGTAVRNFKYDLEVLPRETTFPVRLQLLVPGPAGTSPAPVETELLGLLADALSGLSPGEISMGAKRSRGFGKLASANWRAIRFDLTTRTGWLSWAKSDHEHPCQREKTHPTALAAIQAIRPAATGRIDKRLRTVFNVDLTFQGGLLIGSTPVDVDQPDSVHLQSAGTPVLPGTSVAGALRAHALRIARVVRPIDAEEWVSDMFGPVRRGDNVAALAASRVRIAESTLDGTPLRTTRIQIDRFTHGTVDGAFLEEEPLFEGTTRLQIELRNPNKGEAGLLLLVLKDLLAGDLPLGGSASIGRGVVRAGSVEVKLAHTSSGKAQTYAFSTEGADPAVATELNRLVTDFADAKRPEPREVAS